MESRGQEDNLKILIETLRSKFSSTANTPSAFAMAALAEHNSDAVIDLTNLKSIIQETQEYCIFLQTLVNLTPEEISNALESKIEALHPNLEDTELATASAALPMLLLIEFSKFKALRNAFLEKHNLARRDDSAVIELEQTGYFPENLTVEVLQTLAKYFTNIDQQQSYPFLDEVPESTKDILGAARLHAPLVGASLVQGLLEFLQKIQTVKISSLADLKRQFDFNVEVGLADNDLMKFLSAAEYKKHNTDVIYDIDQQYITELTSSVERCLRNFSEVQQLVASDNLSPYNMINAGAELKRINTDIGEINQQLILISAIAKSNSNIRKKMADSIKSICAQLKNLGVDSMDPDLYFSHPESIKSALSRYQLSSSGEATETLILSVKIRKMTNDLSATLQELLRKSNVFASRLGHYSQSTRETNDQSNTKKNTM